MTFIITMVISVPVVMFFCFLSFSIKFATAVDDIPLRQTPPIHDKQLSVADDAFQLAISDTSFRGALQRNATR